ncbi:SPOR domain-containing protein [Sansalvadorimonas verongulae]|uniref:SPOR domain-containing protein n=1 Tax=Sansalvadorimonas verongulae TaxID=2172824 RepID=UPI0012BBD1EE|nr:SPOR domain-containing protein [Sansalvadorimonas verongulae]MTI15583.1 hypothetical protein [Sansalvadorimonas verongulae]
MAGAKRRTGKQAGSGKKQKKADSSSLRVPGWLWLIAGIAIGGFSMMLLELSPNVGVMPELNPSSTAKSKEPENKGPVFDFYTLLPESEVVVPSKNTAAGTSQAEPAKKPVVAARPAVKEVKPVPETVSSRPSAVTANPAAGSVKFLLQAGSFRNSGDAERLHAQLLLTGFQSRVEAVTVRGGERWYRVQLGPFHSEPEVNSTRQKLASQGLETMLLRQK